MKILYLTKISFFSGLKMNYILLFGSIMFFSTAKGQGTSNYIALDTSTAIEEKLVQLALQSPEVQNTAHLTKVNEYQLKAAQNIWMNTLTLSANYNDQTFAQNNL